MEIDGRKIGPGEPCYIIAELSANHGQQYDHAVELIHAAHASGADAIKLQTYTPDTITLDSDGPSFQLDGTIWAGRTLHQVYAEAYTPWEWTRGLKVEAEKLGLALFSTPFDPTAVEFLKNLDVSAYKIASFEIVDIPLIRMVAACGKPMIISTGMASVAEIDDAVTAAREEGCEQIALLKCTSSYPSPPESMNLRAISTLSRAFDALSGLSDHTLGIAAPVVAVTQGASLIEKHLTMSRDVPGPDSAFSLEPAEFTEMVRAVRDAELALGSAQLGGLAHDAANRRFRRSLYAVEDINAGDIITTGNVRSIRPADGLAPKHYRNVLGKKAARHIERGTPLSWHLIE